VPDVIFHEAPPKLSSIAIHECVRVLKPHSMPYLRMIVVVKTVIGLLVSAALVVAPSSVFARKFGDLSVQESAQELSHSEGAGTSKGRKILVDARVSIQHAITIAETRVKGARIFDIDFDEEFGEIVYKVKTFQHNEIWTGTINASLGEIIGEGAVTPIASLEEKEKAELANFSTSGMNLSEAIAVAEEYGVGSAISAGLEERSGKTIFVVIVVADGALREVAVEMGPPCRFKKGPHGERSRHFSIVDGRC
jgi:uncharacterized membrane protein YkoI